MCKQPEIAPELFFSLSAITSDNTEEVLSLFLVVDTQIPDFTEVLDSNF